MKIMWRCVVGEWLPSFRRNVISFFIMKFKTGDLALFDPLEGREPVLSKRRVSLNQQRSVTSQKTRILASKFRKDSAACIKLRCTYKQAKSTADNQLLHNDSDVTGGHTSAPVR